MSPRPGIDVEIKGPLATKGAKITRDAAEDAVLELIEIGEGRLFHLLRPEPMGVFKSVAEARLGRASKGTYRLGINRDVRGLRGRLDDGGAIYGPWLEGTSSRNKTTRFPGYRTFRTVNQELEKQSKEVLEKHIGKAVRRMRGK